MRISAALALLLVSACARDLDLPTAPTGPERLGELSGIYSMSIFATLPGLARPVEFPVNAELLVLHLDKPGDEAQPLVMLIDDGIVDLVPSLPSAPVDDPALLLSRMFEGGFDGKGLSAKGFGTLALQGTEAPGAGGLTLAATDLTICPRTVEGSQGGQSMLHARRLCDFDPALSGVYRGNAGSCGGALDQPTYLGMGFFDNLVLGLRYPEDQEFLFAGYNRFTGAGGGLVGTGEGKAELAGFQISEADGKLHVDMTVASLDGTCQEKRSMDFLGTPGATTTCSPLGLAQAELGAEALVRVEAGRRYLDVRVYPSSDPLLTFPAATELLSVSVEATDGARAVPVAAAATPDTATARFAIDDPGVGPRYYEMTAFRVKGDGQGGNIVEFAPASCLRDRR